MDTPNVSAWRMASTNERSSATSVRFSMARMASAREAPARTSPSMRANSSVSGPGTERDGAVERLLEAEARLHADHQQVEHVRELLADVGLALLDLSVQDGVGAEDADGGEERQPRSGPVMPLIFRTPNTRMIMTGARA